MYRFTTNTNTTNTTNTNNTRTNTNTNTTTNTNTNTNMEIMRTDRQIEQGTTHVGNIIQAVVCVPSLVSPGGGSVLAPSARGDLS